MLHVKVKSSAHLIGVIAASYMLVSTLFDSKGDVPPPCVLFGVGISGEYHCLHDEPITFIFYSLVYFCIGIYFFVSAFEIKKSEK